MKQYLKIFLPTVIMLMTAMGTVSCQQEERYLHAKQVIT